MHTCAPSRPTAPRPDPNVSFSDLYRGTQWDTELANPRPRVAAQSSDGPSVLLIAGLSLVAVAVVGVLVMLAGLPPSPASFAGANSTARPTRVPTARLPTRPPATSQTPSPTPLTSHSVPATPAASVPLPDDPAQAFALLMSNPSYVAQVEGQFEIGNEAGSIEIMLRRSGRDLEAESVVAQGRERVRQTLVIKDDRAFVRLAGDPWQMAGAGSVSSPDVFSNIEPDSLHALIDAGMDRYDGRRLRHLELPTFDWPSISRMFYLDADGGGAVIRDMSVDVWISDSGIPHAAEVWFDATVTDAGLEVDFSYEMTYRFERFGQPVAIDAPRVGGGQDQT